MRKIIIMKKGEKKFIFSYSLFFSIFFFLIVYFNVYSFVFQIFISKPLSLILIPTWFLTFFFIFLPKPPTAPEQHTYPPDLTTHNIPLTQPCLYSLRASLKMRKMRGSLPGKSVLQAHMSSPMGRACVKEDCER
jgi:hypothetical protein